MKIENFYLLNYAWIGIALITFLSLVILKIRAPYGRHTSRKWGKMISNHWGWFWMELPAFLLFPIVLETGILEFVRQMVLGFVLGVIFDVWSGFRGETFDFWESGT